MNSKERGLAPFKGKRPERFPIIDIFGSDYKYIAAASHDYILPEIPARNIVAMFDEVKKYGLGRMV